MKKQQHLQYLRSFEIDLSVVGSLLAKGKQHLVFAYGKDQVIKVPRSSAYNKLYGLIPARIIKTDLQLLEKYCSDFIPNTQVLVSKKKYIIIQKRVLKPAFVTQFTVEKVKPDLEKLLASGEKLFTEQGLFLDIFGYQGMIQSILALLQMNKTRALMTNVIIDFGHAKPKLYLVDTNLTSLPQQNHPANIFHRVVDLITIMNTRILASWAFGLRI